jgi:hypothetical protein
MRPGMQLQIPLCLRLWPTPTRRAFRRPSPVAGPHFRDQAVSDTRSIPGALRPSCVVVRSDGGLGGQTEASQITGTEGHFRRRIPHFGGVELPRRGGQVPRMFTPGAAASCPDRREWDFAARPFVDWRCPGAPVLGGGAAATFVRWTVTATSATEIATLT